MTTGTRLRSSARTTARQAIRHSAAAIDRVRPPAEGLVVLAYHRIGAGTDSSVDTPLDEFRRQMLHLNEHHAVVSLESGVEGLDAPDPRSEVAVTFDDGTRDFHDNALPVLTDLGIPATVYVATSFVEDRQEFPWGAPPMTWDELEACAASGLITVEAHTHEHRVMDKLDRNEAEDDLGRCNELITARLGRSPRHFAYPKGVLGSPGAEQVIRTMYRSAASGRVGVNERDQDRHQLLRTPIQTMDTGRWFHRKARGGLAFEGLLRETVNSVRYRGATS